MGSVYQRDVDAYQRAVDAYRRKAVKYNAEVGAYNDKVNAYNATRVTDANGNMYVADNFGQTYVADANGNLTEAALPGGAPLSQYGLTALPGDNNYRLVRQNPTERKYETRDVQGDQGLLSDNGQVSYYEYDSGPRSPGVEWTAVGDPRLVKDPETGYYGRMVQTYQRDASVYAEKPDASAMPTAPAAFNKKAPQLTFGAARRASEPTMAQVETGLIGEVLGGRKAK